MMFGMQLRSILILGQCMYFCNLFTFSRGKALVGENVRQSKVGEFPYVVSLADRNPANFGQCRHFCTGTLVSNRDVLTAAHCFVNKSVNAVAIIIGNVDLRQGQRFAPLWFLTYDYYSIMRNFTPTYVYNDIGIARLALNVSSAIQPVPLSDMKNDKLAGCEAIIVGWGRIKNEKRPHVLQNGDVTIIDHSQCMAKATRLIGKKQYMEPSLLCSVADPYILTRQGDSGSPLLRTNVILGVTIGTCPTLDNVDFHPEKMNLHLGIFLFRDFVYDTIHNI